MLKIVAEQTRISEEGMALLMKEIFKEEFKKQEGSILDISDNFEIMLNLKQENSKLKSSLDFAEDGFEKKMLKNSKKSLNTLKQGYEISTSTTKT